MNFQVPQVKFGGCIHKVHYKFFGFFFFCFFFGGGWWWFICLFVFCVWGWVGWVGGVGGGVMVTCSVMWVVVVVVGGGGGGGVLWLHVLLNFQGSWAKSCSLHVLEYSKISYMPFGMLWSDQWNIHWCPKKLEKYMSDFEISTVPTDGLTSFGNKLSLWDQLAVSTFLVLGPGSIWTCHLTSIGNPIVEIRRSDDRLISTMGFPILLRRHLYIDSEPWIWMYGPQTWSLHCRCPNNWWCWAICRHSNDSDISMA